MKPNFSFLVSSCHTRNAGMALKMVSDACKSAYGYEERHQLVLSTQAARKERQSYRTKEKFKRLERGMQKLKEPNM